MRGFGLCPVRTADGLPLLEQAIEQNRPTFDSSVMINLGQGCLLAARVEDAMRLAESALELTRKRKERGLEARALMASWRNRRTS